MRSFIVKIIASNLNKDQVTDPFFITVVRIDREPIIVFDDINLAEDEYKASTDVDKALIMTEFDEQRFIDWTFKRGIKQADQIEFEYLDPPIKHKIDDMVSI